METPHPMALSLMPLSFDSYSPTRGCFFTSVAGLDTVEAAAQSTVFLGEAAINTFEPRLLAVELTSRGEGAGVIANLSFALSLDLA